MFPYSFHDDKAEQGIFDMRPELEEFKKSAKNLDKLKTTKVKNGSKAKPVNSNYKTKNGETYGLYQRFYWDETNVPFAGRPNM